MTAARSRPPLARSLSVLPVLLAAAAMGISAAHGADVPRAPYGPGYAGYYQPNYYVGSRAAPPRYSYPLPIAPQQRWYGRPAPWSPAWFDGCSARYRSFDPRTGYFTTYSGRKVFCR